MGSSDEKICWMPAMELIHAKRIDLMAKYTYAEYRNKNYDMTWAKELYAKHIEAFSGGNYCEPKNPEKCSLDAYIDVLEHLIRDIGDTGFDKEKSLIPISKAGIIGDGAHRVAVSAYFEKEVCCIDNDNESNYNYAFFRKQHLNDFYLDYMVTKYVELKKDNIYIICIWPSATKDSEKLKSVNTLVNERTNVIYDKKIKLTYNGLKNLMIQAYANHSWVGTVENGFNGVKGKVDPCYDKKGELCIYIVEHYDGLKGMLELKHDIREMFGMGNHSIHTSDTYEETLSLIHALLNENSVHFLNNGKINYDKNTLQRIMYLRDFLKMHKKDSEQFIIDASTVLSLYGIRKVRDLDYLCMPEQETGLEKLEEKQIDNHKDCIKWYEKSLSDLIMNPHNYFYFFDMKIITLEVLKTFKSNRSELKDKEDVKLINDFLKKTKTVWGILARRYIELRRVLRNFKTKIRDFLQKNNIFFFTKLWHFIVGKGFK